MFLHIFRNETLYIVFCQIQLNIQISIVIQLFQRNYRSELTNVISQNPSATVQTALDIMDSTTGVNFDENGIRRPFEYMKNLGKDMQTESNAAYCHRPTKTADDSIPADIQYIRQINECCAQQGRRNKMQKQLTNFHLINKFSLSVQP